MVGLAYSDRSYPDASAGHVWNGSAIPDLAALSGGLPGGCRSVAGYCLDADCAAGLSPALESGL